MTSKEIINNIPSRLEQAMKYRNYTVERLSNETNIGVNRIKSILSGAMIPELIDMAVFSACLDISCDYLCSAVDEIKRNSSVWLRDEVPMNMSEESIDILRRIVSIYMYSSDKERQELLNTLI